MSIFTLAQSRATMGFDNNGPRQVTSTMNSTNIEEKKAKGEDLIPRWNFLPSVDLYMDQVIAYVNSELGDFFNRLGCQPLTKSMVNNYVKAKIVAPPVNKKYDRISMAMIIVVYLLKTCFSTEEVRLLLRMGMDLPDHATTYNRFCEAVENALYSVFSGHIHVDEVAESGRERRYLVDNFALAFACKAYVQKTFISITE